MLPERFAGGTRLQQAVRAPAFRPSLYSGACHGRGPARSRRLPRLRVGSRANQAAAIFSISRRMARSSRKRRISSPASLSCSASLRSGERPEWARILRCAPWRETGSSAAALAGSHLASAEVAPAAFGAETGCLNGLLEDPPTESGAGAGVSAVPLFRSLPWKGTFVFRVFGSIPCEPGGRHFQHFSENGPLFAQAADLLPGVLDLHL